MKYQKTLCITAGIALLLAIYSFPYGYYIFLRWAIMLISIYVAILKFQGNYKTAGLILLSVAILFNPFVPITMAKSSWAIFDFITAMLFFVFSYTDE